MVIEKNENENTLAKRNRAVHTWCHSSMAVIHQAVIKDLAAAVASHLVYLGHNSGYRKYVCKPAGGGSLYGFSTTWLHLLQDSECSLFVI